MPSIDDHIGSDLWARDHWSTLAYIENVMVECGGFEVGQDARMRSNRGHLRVMREQCPEPRRPGRLGISVSMGPEGGTRLADGSIVKGHDDWNCMQDMANEGLFTFRVEDIEPGVTLHLSPKGREWCGLLRTHKAAGGSYGNFKTEMAVAMISVDRGPSNLSA